MTVPVAGVVAVTVGRARALISSLAAGGGGVMVGGSPWEVSPAEPELPVLPPPPLMLFGDWLGEKAPAGCDAEGKAVGGVCDCGFSGANNLRRPSVSAAVTVGVRGDCCVGTASRTDFGSK